jgi:hypothetical protein
MPNLSIDKKAFLNLIPQFKSDIVFQEQLVKTILAQMPVNYRDRIVTEYFLQNIYSKPYWFVEHHLYQYDSYYFLDMSDVVDFLSTRTIDPSLPKITSTLIRRHIEQNKTLNGYYIFKKGDK